MNKPKRILIMAQHYAPEDVSGAVLATQLAEDLAAKGLDVTFITSAPSYPLGKVYPGYRNSVYATERKNGVRIIRTWSLISPSKSFPVRVINQVSFSFSSFFVGLISGKYDVIFSYSPPLPLGIAASWLSKLKGVPLILRIEDLFPDSAIEGGIIKNKIATWVLHRIEKRIYSKATHISAISKTFKELIVTKGIDETKVSVTSVWADPDEIQPEEKENFFRQENGLVGKFVILYSGNLGYTSALEEIIPVCEGLQRNPDIEFLIVGEGIKKFHLEKSAKEAKLKNIRFLPYQDRVVMPHVLAAADVSIVTINAQSSRYSLPSKIFSYMASARPIVAISPRESEIAQIIQETKCGINVENGHTQEVIDSLYNLYQSKALAEKLGLNGRKALEQEYSREICIDQFRQIVNRYAI